MNQMQYGAYLRSLRISQGKGKEEVARTMGIPVELLEAWEDGVRLPTEQELQLLSAVLQVTYDQICPPDAPRKKRGLSHSQIALIIAGGIFALAMSIYSMRTMDLSSLSGTSNLESKAASMIESAMTSSFTGKEEAQVALDHIQNSAFFQQSGLNAEDLSLANYDTHYRYSEDGLILETAMEYTAGAYRFQITCQRSGGLWRVTDSSAVIPLE